MRKMLAVLVILLAVITNLNAAVGPNVLVIMADDLGYGDVGCYGALPENVKTPHIDKLAEEGLRFMNGYCSASTCTPTRFSFLTGQYAFRQKGTGIGAINTAALIEPGRVTLPEILKRAGYATAVVGKWHLGLGPVGEGPQWNSVIKPGPLDIGFDYAFLLPNTNDRVPSVFVENDHVRQLDLADPLTVSMRNPDGQPTGKDHRDSLRMDWSHGHNATIHNGISRIGFMSGGKAALWRDEDLALTFVQQATEWIKANKDRPFFMFFASHDCHVPRMPNERFQGESPMGYRGDSIVQLDWTVGRLMAALKDNQLDQNTLVIFCSDNGPVLDDGYKDGAVEKIGTHRQAGPYRGGKYTVYEGGTRIPFITRWPGHIRPGVSNEIVCTVDLAASMAAMTGQSLPADACPDSFNLYPALLGQKDAHGRDHLVQQGNTLRQVGYRSGDWKLIAPGEPKKAIKPGSPGVALYNLAQDPGEEKNLAKIKPQKTAEMLEQVYRIIKAGKSRP